MARGRSGFIDAALAATVRSQSGALICGTIGLVIISPVPRKILDSISPGDLTDNPFVGAIGNGYLGAAYFVLIFARIFGFLLVALAIASLIVKGKDGRYRTHLRTRSQNNIAAGVMAAVFFIMVATSPPRLLPNEQDSAAITAKLAGTPVPQPSKVEIGTDFPANGTIQWGSRGQPIGGNFGRLDIWDVTRSPENKVVKIRSGMVMEIGGVRAPAYAIVYIRAGERVTLNIPKNTVYKITAMAGPEWKGGESMFGPEATVVDFGQVILSGDTPQVIAMGAPDQSAYVVSSDRF